MPNLQVGVRTIPPAGIFPSKATGPLDPAPLSVHMSNWQSAEDDLPLTRELVQQEIDKGWVLEYPGSLEQAQDEYPTGVAIGSWGSHTPRVEHLAWWWIPVFVA